MSELKQLQRRMASAVMTPLTRNDGMRPKLPDGRSMRAEANQFIRPNDRLTSFERLEIYNQQYWFRVLDAFAVDFPGLRAVVGAHRFEQLSLAYLTECPSRSFTLRNLGSRLLGWLRKNPEWIQPQERLSLDIVRLELADIEAFDSAEEPVVGPEDLLEVTPTTRFGIQPYIQLLQLAYPVDDLLLAVQNDSGPESDSSSNAGSHERKRHPVVEQMQRLQPERIYLVVHRREYIVCHRRLTPEAFRMLRSLQKGNTLGVALDHAMRGSRLPESEIAGQIREWFTDWSQIGWFCKSPDADSAQGVESTELRNQEI